MTLFEAIFLGILQGITEFLPVSSSGHLKLAQHLFGYENLEKYLLFDLVCHLGSLAAILVFFFDRLQNLFFEGRRLLFGCLVATLPLLPLPLAIKPIKGIMHRPELLGFFFLATALLLFIGIRGAGKRPNKSLTACFVIGCFQALAVLPGISRSGSTISAARLFGWGWKEAIFFSFLLALPALFGAGLFELLSFLRNPQEAHPIALGCYLAGFMLSSLFGYLSLGVLTKLAEANRMKIFVWYCLLLGIFCLVYI